jgi:hypothetical protein
VKNLDTTLRVLQELQSTFSKVTETAVSLGAKPYGLNEKNALLTVLKAAESYAECETEVKALGYTSLAVALKALGQTNRPLVELPEALKHAPSHWVTEDEYETEYVWKNCRQVQKVRLVKGVNARTAQRRRAGLQRDLEELWLAVRNDPYRDQDTKDEYFREVLVAYRKDTYSDFSARVLQALNDFHDAYETEEEEETNQDAQEHTPDTLEKLALFKAQCEEDGVEYNEEAALSLLETT